MAQATVYTWNLDAEHFKNNGTLNGSKHTGSYTTSEGIKWDFTRTRKEGDIDLAHIAKSGDYVQFGGGSDNQGESLELTTSNIPNKIVRIEVECYSEVTDGHSLSIKVNSKPYGSGNTSTLALTTKSQTYVATPISLNQPEKGAITILFASKSKDADLYVKSVRIYTDEPLFSHVRGRWGNELLANGINVCIGSDDIMDPWYPMGKGSPLAGAALLMNYAQLSGYPQVAQLIDMITCNSAKTMCIKDYGLKVGNPANMIVLDAESEFDAIRLQSECLYVIRRGRIVCRTVPACRTLEFEGRQENIDFRLTAENL